MSSDLTANASALNKFSKLSNARRGRFARTVLLTALLFTASCLNGCTKKTEVGAGQAKTESSGGDREVSLAIWANYLSPEMQEKFTKDTGIRLRISNFSSSEELLAKMQAGSSGIDVAVPSDYMVGVMAKLGLLQPLDNGKIPNKAGLDPELLKREYDPDNTYSLPYSWTIAGIAINRELFKGKLNGWKDLFGNKDLAGKLSLLDDAREVTAAALKLNGSSVNATAPTELAKAEAILKEVRPRVKMFTSDVIDPLVKKDVAVAHAYSSDALQARRSSGGKIDFILPEEGGTRAIDNLVIVKGSKHLEEAHRLINFLLSVEANTAFVKAIMGGPVVLKTRERLPAELKNDPILFPKPGSLSKFEYIHDVGEATRAFDRLWTEVRAQ